MKRYEQYKNLLRFGLDLLIWSIHIWLWISFWNKEYASVILSPFGPRGTVLVYGIYGIFSYFFTNLYGGYRIGYYRRTDLVLSGCIAVVFTNSVIYLQTCLIGRTFMQVAPIIWMSVADILSFVIWAFASCAIYEKIFPPHEILMVYGESAMPASLVRKMGSRAEKYSIQESIGIDASESEIEEKILAHSSVLLCDVPPVLRNRLVKFSFEHNIRTYVTSKLSDILIRSAEEITLFDTPLLLNRNNGMSLEQKFLKRMVDIIFSLLLLIAATPFMLLTAILIKLQDGGPVLFRQARATRDNKIFYVCKFRSMIIDAEKDGKPRPAISGDSRITTFGRFIRKTRLDELPQFWNILIGDMSLVGPRPERLEYVEQYTSEIPEFAYRLKVRAGLTGYAQVFGKYNTSAYDKLKMDLTYITKYSLLLDMKIILMTIKVMFKSESTEGMAQNEAYPIKDSEKRD